MHSDWIASPFAHNFLSVEKPYTDRALRQISGPSVLLLGPDFDAELLANLDFPQLVSVTPAGPTSTNNSGSSSTTDSNPTTASRVESTTLAADNAFLPFAEKSFASVVLPHALEQHELPHQVLREVHRVLQPEGHLLLTCFNPYSFVGLQRVLRRKNVPKGQFYSLSRVKDWLHLLGFEVVGSAMYHYAPICKGPRLNRNLAFLNSAGDRWLPLSGGSYLISARKRDVACRLVGKERFRRSKRSGRLTVTAAQAAQKNSPDSFKPK